MDDRTSFVQKVHWIFNISHDLRHLCRGKRIQTSRHSDFGTLRNRGASCNLEMISMIFAAVFWDAADPCSVKIALATDSSFAVSFRSTTRLLHFSDFGFTSAFLR